MITRIAYNLRGRWLALRISLAGGQCGPGLKVESGFRLGFPLHKGFTLGRDVYFGPNTLIDCPPGAVLTIGDSATFTAGAVIGCHERVTIGSDVLVGEYVSIRDGDHGFEPGGPIRCQPMKTEPVTIATDVWIGRGAAVLKGAHLSYGSVLAANAVHRGDCPPYAIFGGVPARQIGSRLSGAEAFSPAKAA